MDIDDFIIEKAEENDCNNVVDLIPFRLGYLAALIELSKPNKTSPIIDLDEYEDREYDE